ncbi:PH domain-containing protein [Cellulomonas sp. URHB0016]
MRTQDPLVGHHSVRRYVLPEERVVLAVRHHWAKLVEPVATTLVAFVLIAWLVDTATGAVGDAAEWIWWFWLVVAVRLGWRLLEWRTEWFVATDKRMLLLHGLVTRNVAMMPLGKVTDMSYSRSVLGRLLGYGEFILESAGQDQAMRRITWVAHPDVTYRDLCAIIFTPPEAGPPAPARPTGPPVAARPTRPGSPGASGPAQGSPPAGRPVDWPRRPGGHPTEGGPFAPDDTQPLPVRVVPGRPADQATGDPGWFVSDPPATFVPVDGPGDPDGTAGQGGQPDRGRGPLT